MDFERALKEQVKADVGALRGDMRADVADALARARAMRRHRTAGLALVGLSATVVTIFAGISLVRGLPTLNKGDGDGSVGSPSTRTDAATSDGAEVHSAARVASFGVRAAAHAGLLDPFGRFYDYRSIERGPTSGWYVQFAPMQCTRTVQVETCTRSGQGARLHVDLSADGFVVLSAEGPMTEQHRAKLLSYTEDAVSEPAVWEYPVVALKDAVVDWATTDIKATSLWTGPIPSDAVSPCTLRVFDEAGKVVAEKRLPRRDPPRSEDGRAGDLYVTSMSSESRPTTATIECD